MLIMLWDVKAPTHYSYKSRVIPVLWLSFVCECGVGEVGHLLRDLGVLLCPFPLGNKSCPVKWTKSQKLASYGVDYRALKWFDSYLSDRQQKCIVNGELSGSRAVTCGVPQGKPHWFPSFLDLY